MDVEIHPVQPHNGLTMMRAGLNDINFKYRGYRFVDATDADHGWVYLCIDEYRDPSRIVFSEPRDHFGHWETTTKARKYVDRLLDIYEEKLTEVVEKRGGEN